MEIGCQLAVCLGDINTRQQVNASKDFVFKASPFFLLREIQLT